MLIKGRVRGFSFRLITRFFCFLFISLNLFIPNLQYQNPALKQRQRSRSNTCSKGIRHVICSDRKREEESNYESENQNPHVFRKYRVPKAAKLLEEAHRGSAENTVYKSFKERQKVPSTRDKFLRGANGRLGFVPEWAKSANLGFLCFILPQSDFRQGE